MFQQQLLYHFLFSSHLTRPPLGPLSLPSPSCLPACLPQRNLFLVEDAEARFARAQRRQLSGQRQRGERERPAKAEDVVRLYDALLAIVSELNELAVHVGGAAGEALLDDCAAKVRHWGLRHTPALALVCVCAPVKASLSPDPCE